MAAWTDKISSWMGGLFSSVSGNGAYYALGFAVCGTLIAWFEGFISWMMEPGKVVEGGLHLFAWFINGAAGFLPEQIRDAAEKFSGLLGSAPVQAMFKVGFFFDQCVGHPAWTISMLYCCFLAYSISLVIKCIVYVWNIVWSGE